MPNIILTSAACKKNKFFLLSKFIEKWKEKKNDATDQLIIDHFLMITIIILSNYVRGFFVASPKHVFGKKYLPCSRQKIALLHHNNGFNFCRIFHLPLTSPLPNSPPSIHGHTHSLPPPMPHRAHTVRKRLATRIRVQWV